MIVESHPRQAIKQRQRIGQLMLLPRRDLESYGVGLAVSDHASLGPIAATRSAKCLAIVPLGCRSALFAPPAPF